MKNIFHNQLCITTHAMVLSMAFTLGLLITSSALAQVDDPNTFELDRDAIDQTPPAGDDWETLYDECGNTGGETCGNASAFTGIVPDTFTPANQDFIFTMGGSKDDLPIEGWRNKQAKPTPDKDNITNAYAAAYTNEDGETIIVFGADRYANNGDAQIGIWFFQHPFGLGDGDFGTSTHVNNDLLVLANFEGGGLDVTVEVWEWCEGCGTDGNINLKKVATGAQCVDNADQTACALTNLDSTNSPWAFEPKFGTSGVFPPASFFEGGVNLSDLFPSGAPCFSSFLVETRSSSSVDAVLKDFAFGSFPLCSIKATKECTNDTAEVGEGPGNLTYDLRGCVYAKGGDVTNLSLENDIVGDMIGSYTPSPISWYRVPMGFTVPDDCTDEAALINATATGTSFDPTTDTLSPGDAVVYYFQETTALNTPQDTVEVSATGVDGTAINPTTATATCPQQLFPASIMVDKYCAADLVEAGGLVAVQINFGGTVCNTGDVELTNVVLEEDPMVPVSGTVTISPQNFTLAPSGETGDCQDYTGSYRPSSIPGGDVCPFTDQVIATGTADGDFADPGAPGCTLVGVDVECSDTSNNPTCNLRATDGDNDCATGPVNPTPPM